MQVACLLLGRAGRVFSVSVDPQDTIGDLKDAIHATLAHTDATDLDLFAAQHNDNWLSASSHEVKALEKGRIGSVRNLFIQHLPLESAARVAEIFVDLPPNTIHVLVRVPLSIELTGLRVGIATEPFTVEINSTASISELKATLHAMLKLPFVADELDLFAAKKTTENEWLSATSTTATALATGDLDGLDSLLDHPLEKTAIVHDVFADDSGGPPPDSVHVLMLERRVKEALPVLKLLGPLGRRQWRGMKDDIESNKPPQHIDVDVLMPDTVDYLLGLPTQPYRQVRQAVPDAVVRVLYEYMSTCHEKAGVVFATVLLTICRLVGDAYVRWSPIVEGVAVHANVQLDFQLVVRGATRLCVILARAGSTLDDACARVFIGSEAVADLEDLFVVYGLATNFAEWDLYRCGEHAVQRDRGTLDVTTRGLSYESLRDLCSLVYGVLSSDDDDENV